MGTGRTLILVDQGILLVYRSWIILQSSKIFFICKLLVIHYFRVLSRPHTCMILVRKISKPIAERSRTTSNDSVPRLSLTSSVRQMEMELLSNLVSDVQSIPYHGQSKQRNRHHPCPLYSPEDRGGNLSLPRTTTPSPI